MYANLTGIVVVERTKDVCVELGNLYVMINEMIENVLIKEDGGLIVEGDSNQQKELTPNMLAAL